MTTLLKRAKKINRAIHNAQAALVHLRKAHAHMHKIDHTLYNESDIGLNVTGPVLQADEELTEIISNLAEKLKIITQNGDF